MSNILQEEIKEIKSYKLCCDTSTIFNTTIGSNPRVSDTMDIMSILEKYSIDFEITENFDFRILGLEIDNV